ncbi:MAG TPA: hypothetical protein VFL64_18300 [Rhizobacter sp.]|nr:hypothetical protein [Rhizobacter sp.]
MHRNAFTHTVAQALRAWVLRFASSFFPAPKPALRPIRIRIRRDR